MTISAVMNNAVHGMRSGTERLASAAHRIATIDTPLSGGTQPADLAAEMTGMIGAEIAFKANASVFETGADLWDVLMTVKRD